MNHIRKYLYYITYVIKQSTNPCHFYENIKKFFVGSRKLTGGLKILPTKAGSKILKEVLTYLNISKKTFLSHQNSGVQRLHIPTSIVVIKSCAISVKMPNVTMLESIEKSSLAQNG